MHKPSGKNENCLAGMVCPQCGNEDSFLVETSILVLVTDDGTDQFANEVKHRNDNPWLEEGHAECPKCKWEGTTGQLYP